MNIPANALSEKGELYCGNCKVSTNSTFYTVCFLYSMQGILFRGSEYKMCTPCLERNASDLRQEGGKVEFLLVTGERVSI